MANIVLIPAAGVGSRFEANLPKQYAPILGKPMLQHTLDLLAKNRRIGQIFVVISPVDNCFFEKISLPENASVLALGGATRAETISNGLNFLIEKQIVNLSDWILVHDAARCCLPQDALNRLLDALTDEYADCGALLAVPVADTLKQQNMQQHAQKTVSREGLWQAQTPQAFLTALLQNALKNSDLKKITDDASAVEQFGAAPKLVLGDTRNIKLTRLDDADLAAYFLSKQI